MRIVEKILKAIVYLWAAFWAAFMTYIIVGIRLGKLKGEHCECGGFRGTSEGKLYGWVFK